MSDVEVITWSEAALDVLPADVALRLAEGERDQLAHVAGRICCELLIAQWASKMSGDVAPGAVEDVVATVLEDESVPWYRLVLDRFDELKAAAHELVAGRETPEPVTARSRDWRRWACGYADRDDRGNAVAYLACAIHIELPDSPIWSIPRQHRSPQSRAIAQISDRRQRLVICAAGGCHVPVTSHERLRHALRFNVATA